MDRYVQNSVVWAIACTIIIAIICVTIYMTSRLNLQ